MINKNNSGTAIITGWLLSWLSGAFRALVFMKGWSWFVTTTFDIPNPGFYPIWGLSLLIGFATMTLDVDQYKETPNPWFAFGVSLIYSTLVWVSLIILSNFV